jgi:uncharacterized membrane-anchored protein
MRRRVLLAAFLAGALQTSAIAAMIVSRALHIQHGREIILDVVPVDPRSLLRGDYVDLSYTISSLPVTLLERSRSAPRGARVYVILERQECSCDSEKWSPAAASLNPITIRDPEKQIELQGNLTWAVFEFEESNARFWVNYGIESYFVPENTGEELERQARAGTVKAAISVSPEGHAVIKALIVDGKRMGSPLF